MSGSSPNDIDLHVSFGDSLTSKQVSISRRWTIGNVRDKVIAEMSSHLRSHDLQLPMPTADQVRFFGGHKVKNQTILADLDKTRTSSSVVALVTPPAGFSVLTALEKRIDTKLEEAKSKHDNELEVVKSELEVVKSELKEMYHKLSQQLDATNEWIVHEHTQDLDQIVLRNLLDKAQAVLAHEFGLGSNSQSRRNFMSHNWRTYVMDIDKGNRIENVKALLSGSTNPTMRKLSASAAVLDILTDGSPRIRVDGDKVAHEAHINRKKYIGAISRCKSDDARNALNLFLDLVINYQWQ